MDIYKYMALQVSCTNIGFLHKVFCSPGPLIARGSVIKEGMVTWSA